MGNRLARIAGLVALFAALGVQAQVVGSLGVGDGTFLSLTTSASGGACGSTASCSLGGTYGITEGSVVTGTSGAFLPLPAGAPAPRPISGSRAASWPGSISATASPAACRT